MKKIKSLDTKTISSKVDFFAKILKLDTIFKSQEQEKVIKLINPEDIQIIRIR